jgi:DNA-directed RNA polymerase alpha subunit
MSSVGAKYMKMKGISVKMNRHDQQESDLPAELASPARRALVGAGYVRLEQFTRLSEADVLQLHGMGPKAMDQIRRALAARGLSFADSKKSQAKDEG